MNMCNARNSYILAFSSANMHGFGARLDGIGDRLAMDMHVLRQKIEVETVGSPTADKTRAFGSLICQ